MRPVLLGFKHPASKFPAPATPTQLGKPAPAHADFEAAKQNLGYETNPTTKDRLDKMLYNKVRVCPSCSKPNGFTLKNCNSCGTDISKQELSKTLNVFAGFMLGIGKSTFPLSISIRSETPEMLVLDDLLALSPIHVNVIPMKQFIPDWRYLLRNPKAGLVVASQLKAAAVQTVQNEFLAAGGNREEFLKSFTKIGHEDGLSFDAENDLSMGFNFPPSQNQLHLQCICPVVLPYQYYLFEKGTHFTPGRFFPYEYVAQALKFASEKTVPPELLDENAPIEAIVEYFEETHNLNAEKVRLAFCDRFDKNFKKFERWNRDDFSFVAKENEEKKLVVVEGTPQDAESPVDVNATVNKDKLALQSYGRPYNAETGKPTGKFYSFEPKQVESELQFW